MVMKLLAVNEFYVHELIKFVCKAVNNLSTASFIKRFFETNSGRKCIDSSRLLTFTYSSKRSTFPSFSLKHRGSKILILLSRKGLLTKHFGSMKGGEVTDFVHTFRDLYIISNMKMEIGRFVDRILACWWIVLKKRLIKRCHTTGKKFRANEIQSRLWNYTKGMSCGGGGLTTHVY